MVQQGVLVWRPPADVLDRSRVLSATLRPLTTAAAARRSSMRPLVHEPTNTVSTVMSRTGIPASRPMYSRAFSAATLSPGSA